MCYVDLTPLVVPQMLLLPVNMSFTCHLARHSQDSQDATHVSWESEAFHTAI